MKRTTKSIRAMKGKEQIVCITAYDAVTSRLATAADVDLILVGDSLGNVVLGFETTVPVTLDMMVHHTAAVARTKPEALLVADIPFALAHDDFSVLLHACMRLMQEAGAEAVKIEGGVEVAPYIKRLTLAGIPVMGHIGLQPQQVKKLGEYRKFGKDVEAKKLMGDALALEEAGAFAIVAEVMDPKCATEIAKKISIPLVGIGSGDKCDGQIIVIHDILGLTEKPPSFAKQFANLKKSAVGAISAYRDSVRKLGKK